ncbi:Cellulose synthase-like protein [Drosera capensis]
MEPPSYPMYDRTPSGRYKDSVSRDSLESENGSGDYVKYTVTIPPTPDVQPMDVECRLEPWFINKALFTGGFHRETRSSFREKMIESKTSKAADANERFFCAMPGCDEKFMIDRNGRELIPCACDFKVCKDCYVDLVKAGDDTYCPGCKEPYKEIDLHNKAVSTYKPLLSLPSNVQTLPKDENSLTLAEQPSKELVRTDTGIGDFDHAKWLFETKGTYGFGNAICTEGNEVALKPTDFVGKPWRPLTRKARIPPAVISPYRFLVFARFVTLALYLTWRIRHPNYDAMWLWAISVCCELWFAFSWCLDQFPRLNPVSRVTDLDLLQEKFDTPPADGTKGGSDLPGVDIFVSTADPEKEPPLVTANTILSILAVDYPVEKLACYVSDDGGSLLTFEAIAEAATFAKMWVPFCRKHEIEPRNPEAYFSLKSDPLKGKVEKDFVKERRRMKREYDEFKVRINGLSDSIRRRSEAYNANEDLKTLRKRKEQTTDELLEPFQKQKATWMVDKTHWPGTWMNPAPDHAKGDHDGIIQVMLTPPDAPPLVESNPGESDIPFNFDGVNTLLPLLVYVSREKRYGYDHNKKAGAMNALVRASAILSNGPFVLNLDCDHYIHNSQAIREGMCFMIDHGGDRICYVQFPQRFEGIDPSDRYANHNTVFFDINMRAWDGLQGPAYVGTGCLFRRTALYGFDPPLPKDHPGVIESLCCCFYPHGRKIINNKTHPENEHQTLRKNDSCSSPSDTETINIHYDHLLARFGKSQVLMDSIEIAEKEGRPLVDDPKISKDQKPRPSPTPRPPLTSNKVTEAITVISCWYEEKTDWGKHIGWIYGSVTEDVVTGYSMHNRGWRSVYCVTKQDAFRGTAPINLTDRLHQVLRWATGSVEIFFSKNNPLFASSKMKLLQRLAYLNVSIYPFTSIFLILYCLLPALSLISAQFIVQFLNVEFLVYLLLISLTLCLLALLEIKWSKITLAEWWRNEQFWLIGGTSAHLAAVIQGLLKVVAGIDISFKLTSKSMADSDQDEFAEMYVIKWTSLMIPPIVIIMLNCVAIAVGFSRTVYSAIPEWPKLIGGVFFSMWVLAHLYPFLKGLMGKRGKTPTIVFIWSGLISITISLLWVTISPPLGMEANGSRFTFP